MKYKSLVGIIAITVVALFITKATAFADIRNTKSVQELLGITTSSPSATTNTPEGIKINALLQVRIKNIQTRAGQEITRRINALNALTARINQMQKISSDDKASLTTSIQSQITEMTTLQTKITVDDSTTTLLSDVKSITGSYRIFALIIPQGAIEAATDRVLEIVVNMNTISMVLSSRISAAQSAGANVTAAQATLADFNAQVDDANTKSQAATTEVVSLTPDNGVQAQMQSNTAALKDAYAKIKTSQQDLVAARADVQVLLKDFKSFEVSGQSGISATATTTVSVSASTSASTSSQ